MLKFLVLCLVSMVMAAPDKRFLINIDGLDISNILELDMLYCDVQKLLDVLGANPTEEACEAECNKLLTGETLSVYGCPLLCHGLQDLATYFHEEPEPGQENTRCGGASLVDDLLG